MAVVCDDGPERGIELQPTGSRARGISDASTDSDSSSKEKARAGFYPGAHEESQFQRFQWKGMFNQPRYIVYWLVLLFFILITLLMAVYHHQIVDWLTPVSNKLKGTSWGWIIPVVILFIISWPPLFGHEIVAVLCGIIYGFWLGFVIVAAGTFLGEVGNFFAFRYIFKARAAKLERTNLNYCALARVTREGGFLIVFLVRLSAIPGHFSTAVFATCGVNFWLYFFACFVTTPKQMILVYLGVIIKKPNDSQVITNVVLAFSVVVTVAAAGYVYWKMRTVRPAIIEEEKDIIQQEQFDSHRTNVSQIMQVPAIRLERPIDKSEELQAGLQMPSPSYARQPAQHRPADSMSSLGVNEVRSVRSLV